mmetsp:Transcript_84090/g.223207  ORF Transcript_84090/g.223207 Transcript_84090/m.223207 type:complete len:222 (-) Transcript_84090:325-990(-)
MKPTPSGQVSRWCSARVIGPRMRRSEHQVMFSAMALLDIEPIESLDRAFGVIPVMALFARRVSDRSDSRLDPPLTAPSVLLLPLGLITARLRDTEPLRAMHSSSSITCMGGSAKASVMSSWRRSCLKTIISPQCLRRPLSLEQQPSNRPRASSTPNFSLRRRMRATSPWVSRCTASAEMSEKSCTTRWRMLQSSSICRSVSSLSPPRPRSLRSAVLRKERV